MNQIELHLKIDTLLSDGVEKALIRSVSDLIDVNDDARQYFYSKVDETWLDWLWKNGFLDTIKEKSHDPSSYGFKMPELHYLFNMSEKNPSLVTDTLCSFKISPDNFNPEVVDQFTRIASKLKAEHLKKVVLKIRDEKWIDLMGSYTQYGFEYGDMLKELKGAGDEESILILAEAILQTRSVEELKKRKDSYRLDEIFYIHDLFETNLFNYLLELSTNSLEKALSLLAGALTNIINYEGNYLLMDEDFFNLHLSGVEGDTYKEEYKLVLAAIIDIVNKIFNENNQSPETIYNKYFETLPESQVSRRLRLYVLASKPETFKDKLKNEYFYLFEAKRILDVLYGAEYEQALKLGFPFLSNDQKREYVGKVFEIFSNFKDDEDKRWKRHYASCILSVISEHLTQIEKNLAAKFEFKIDPEYKPEPSIGRIRGGTVTPRSPMSSEDFSKFSVQDVTKNLKGELSPDALRTKFKNDDFLNPRDADGVAEQLKGDIKNRPEEYLLNAKLFFNRRYLIPHYTNAYLRGIKDYLAESRSAGKSYDLKNLIELLLTIKTSGERSKFDKPGKQEGRWLSDWDSVHMTICDLLEELIRQKDKITIINFKQFRNQLLEILGYLFDYEDPVTEDEKIKTARMTIRGGGKPETFISDPFSIAINSVRGRAFQVLLHFIYQDASNFEHIKLSDEVKALYTKVLEKENTRAIMFMFGHYLPSFHFRDMEWTRGKLHEIFSSEDKDKYLRLAAWEGYLSNNLYRELFNEPEIERLYEKNITLKLKYPKQKFFKDPKEAIAIHFALALINYEDFGFDNKVLKKFLKLARPEQLSEFISFIGKSYITGENSDVLKDVKSSWKLKRVKEFWLMILKKDVNKDILGKFGTWVDTDSGVFEIKWLATMINKTLTKTGGLMDWDYGLLKSIEKIAEVCPDQALKIMDKHFTATIDSDKGTFPIREDKEWYNAFKIVYSAKDDKIKGNTYNLVSKLIEKGGRPFWDLEKIVKK